MRLLPDGSMENPMSISLSPQFKRTLTFQAMVARDALAKHIYAQLFRWIVDGVNKALVATGHKTKFIGVLDIYGSVL